MVTLILKLLLSYTYIYQKYKNIGGKVCMKYVKPLMNPIKPGIIPLGCKTTFSCKSGFQCDGYSCKKNFSCKNW